MTSSFREDDDLRQWITDLLPQYRTKTAVIREAVRRLHQQTSEVAELRQRVEALERKDVQDRD